MDTHPTWAALLERAVTEPGIVSSAYSQFHNYSLGNQLLAWGQCLARGLQPGPLATFPRWKELGRRVRRGERAIVLCQPVTIKRQPDVAEGAESGPEVLVRFTYRAGWFVLAQTDGAEVRPAEVPCWDAQTALAALDIRHIPFDVRDGNVLGFARQREVAINPVNPHPFKTLFHELAHVLCGHTTEAEQADSEVTPRTLREAEAESVAMICCEALGLGGAAESRGYVQGWWGAGNAIPEKSAQRIFRVCEMGQLNVGSVRAEIRGKLLRTCGLLEARRM